MVLWLCGTPFALIGSVAYARSLVDQSALLEDAGLFDLIAWRTVLVAFGVLMACWAVALTVVTRLAEQMLQRRRSERAAI